MTVFLLPYLNIILYYSGFPLRVATTYARQAIKQQEGMSRLLNLPCESLTNQTCECGRARSLYLEECLCMAHA